MAVPHTYAQVREAAIEALTAKSMQIGETLQYDGFETAVLHMLGSDQFIRQQDSETVRDVFWDLFREGYITLGYNSSNNWWPFFRLSPFGREGLATRNPLRFHDATSYVALIKKRVPDLSPLAETYLLEAVKAFYSGCLLAASVMLGVAAELEFDRLVDVAAANATYGSRFALTQSKSKISQKIEAFRKAFGPIRANFTVEDVDNRLLNIQSILRISRNDAGHAKAAPVSREEAFINLQMFISYSSQLYALRHEFT